MDTVMELLPDLDVRAAWAVGLVVVLAVLRPVRRLGWAVALTVIGAAFATVGAVVTADPVLFGRVGGGAWWLAALAGWLLLAALLAAAAVRTPLRWEPRTGPGAATALAIGAMVVHAGAAWHAGGGLAPLGVRWAAGDLGDDPWSPASGPVTWLVAWLADAVPALDARGGAALVGFVAAGLVVLGAERLGRRWGFVGTARCTAAAVAWAPPLLLAHGAAPAALLATAALVWAWWALAEVWGGRHRAAHLATASGGLLGVAVGLAVWPLIVAPFWLRRLGVRTAGWFAVGLGTALLGAVLVLVPTGVGLGELWRATVALDASVPTPVLAAIVVLALLPLLLQHPLSPTRLSAASGALLLLTVPWWGTGAAGPVAALPFVLLAAVAPDRPQERWPPDATLPEELRTGVGV